jgi:hypothetical protein
VINVFAGTEPGSKSRIDVVASAVRVLSCSGLAVGALAIAGTGILFSWSSLLSISTSLPYMDMATGLAIGFFALSLPLSIAHRVLLGENRNHISVAISSLSSIFAAAIVAILYESRLALLGCASLSLGVS